MENEKVDVIIRERKVIGWRRRKRMKIECAAIKFAFLEISRIKVDFIGVCYQIEKVALTLYNMHKLYSTILFRGIF